MNAHEKLSVIARNLWWSWRPEVRALFRDLDPQAWRAVHRNPIRLLKSLKPAQIEERIQDLELHTRIDRAHRLLQDYLTKPTTWGLTRAGALLARPVVYFSAEFGIHESLPIYSGGLGVLAGDHLKSASDLGIPTVGVGILYHEGYVHQILDREGWQQDVVENVDVADLPLENATLPDGTPLRVPVDLPGRSVFVRVHSAMVGRVRLLLLDARDEANVEADRALTGRLYGGDLRTRIQQEVILGVGGMRAIQMLGIVPSVIHLNEGHSAFAIIERGRQIQESEGLTAHDALREAGAQTVFTTHTPVDAGHDRFAPDLTLEHLGRLGHSMGLSDHGLLALGRVHADDHQAPFCPTVLALRLARRSNGVSALHGRIARRMWRGLWPGRAEDEVPIGHITNGVHVPTWLSVEMHDLFSHRLGPDWLDHICHPDLWARIESIDDAELWETHQVLKARLLAFIKRHVTEARERVGLPPHDGTGLHPEALTIGFARRFATYKRADLLLSDIDRLARLVGNDDRPVQLVFAGRSHPHDWGGKALIQKIARATLDPRFKGRIAFIENYNIHVGRQLVHGVDAWLNNPRRPLEACGTSGEKVILNGGLHASILDGWWAEAYDGANGFAIGSGQIHVDPAVQDRRDAEALFDALEGHVIPVYYDRDPKGIPRQWIRRVKRAMRTLGWRFNADRMVMDYVRECYLPAATAASCRMPAV